MMILDETGWKWYHHVLLSIMSLSKLSISYFPIISKLYSNLSGLGSNLCNSEGTFCFDFTKVLATTGAALLRAWCCSGFNLTLKEQNIGMYQMYHVISNKPVQLYVLYILFSIFHHFSLFIHCFPLRSWRPSDLLNPHDQRWQYQVYWSHWLVSPVVHWREELPGKGRWQIRLGKVSMMILGVSKK